MRIGCAHNGQQTIERHDFLGGINSSAAVEMIADNQMSVCENLEPDQSTGLLKTVDGAEAVFQTTFDIYSGSYDKVNNKHVIFSSEVNGGSVSHNVYVTDLTTIEKVGTLSGPYRPVTCLWDKGILIASGGHLQYLAGTSLTTIDASPDECDTVFVRSGRVVVGVGSKDELHYSNVGNPNGWTDDTGDSSASKYLETGYKDGGKFVGAANLSDDVVIVKDNGYVYRLTGDYPNWQLKRISHEVDCDGRLSMCALTNTVMVLGAGKIQLIDTTQDYGDMKATNIASVVSHEIRSFSPGASMVYMPPLNQVWIFGTIAAEGDNSGYVLVYDCSHGGFYMRHFTIDVVDSYAARNDVFVLRKNLITRLKPRSFIDCGHAMKWRLKAKRLVSAHEFLLKRCQINITPYFEGYAVNHMTIGKVLVNMPTPYSVKLIYGNGSPIYENRAPIYDDVNSNSLYYAMGDPIYQNNDLVYRNQQLIYPIINVSTDIRCTYRNKSIDIFGVGSGGAFILNSINFDIVEV